MPKTTYESHTLQLATQQSLLVQLNVQKMNIE